MLDIVLLIYIFIYIYIYIYTIVFFFFLPINAYHSKKHRSVDGLNPDQMQQTWLLVGVYTACAILERFSN